MQKKHDSAELAAVQPIPDVAERLPASGKAYRVRPIVLLQSTLSMLCNYVWSKQLRPGEHMWTIPVDEERDFDCIFADAISELAELRANRDAALAARELHLMAQWIRTPGNISPDDAIDECARTLENRASFVLMQFGSASVTGSEASGSANRSAAQDMSSSDHQP